VVNTNYFSLITKPVSIEKMLNFFVERDDEIINYLSKIYGNEPEIIENRRQAIIISLKAFFSLAETISFTSLSMISLRAVVCLLLSVITLPPSFRRIKLSIIIISR